jgi:EAL domain
MRPIPSEAFERQARRGAGGWRTGICPGSFWSTTSRRSCPGGAAVNRGQIFRFLSKPCPVEVLHECLRAAVAEHRLTQARTAILDQAAQEVPLPGFVSDADEATKALEHALAAGEFLTCYQPIVDLDTRQVIGAETLIRRQHPEHGLIGPAEFIPFAVHSWLIVQGKCGPLGRTFPAQGNPPQAGSGDRPSGRLRRGESACPENYLAPPSWDKPCMNLQSPRTPGETAPIAGIAEALSREVRRRKRTGWQLTGAAGLGQARRWWIEATGYRGARPGSRHQQRSR